jgi:hypothetical protein
MTVAGTDVSYTNRQAENLASIEHLLRNAEPVMRSRGLWAQPHQPR